MTHGRMPITTWRNFAFCKKFAKNSDLFSQEPPLDCSNSARQSLPSLSGQERKIFLLTVEHRTGFAVLGGKAGLPASPLSPWDSQRLPEARVWRNYKTSLLNKIHLLSTDSILLLSFPRRICFLYNPLSRLLSPPFHSELWNSCSSESDQYAILHTFLACDGVVLLHF